jgi:Protein of unknown function (DUF2971).
MSIINSYNWFSKPVSFNDPFDCQFNVSTKEVSFDDYIKLYSKAKYNSPPPEEGCIRVEFPKGAIVNNSFTSQFKEHVHGFGAHVSLDVKERSILSLSENFDNTTMWSHYANNHEGICVEYNPLILINKAVGVLHKVKYLNPNEIEFNAYKLFASCSNNRDVEQYKSLINEMFLTKSNDWAYEKEWRIVHNAAGKVNYDPDSLTAIYFGLRCGVEEKIAIRNILANKRMAFFQMIKKSQGLGVEAYPMTKDSEYWFNMPAL